MRLAQWIQGESSFARLRELSQSQWTSKDQLRELQWQSIKQSLDHAWALPFYRAFWEQSGLTRSDIKSWEDFQKLPLLTKDSVRSSFHLLTQGELLGQARRGQTSGSTGAPLKFAHTVEFGSRHEAGQWRGRSWFGIRPGDAVLACWGRPVSASENRLLQLKSLLNHTIHVSAFDLTRDYTQKLIPKIKQFRPKLVYGYPSAIYEIAKTAKSLGIRLDQIGVRQVACTAEVLYSFQIDLLQEVFGAPVSNVYGCGEFGAFAHQCPQGNMHISSENVLVEFLSEGKPVESGETGEVVVTSFFNPVMPLIRYVVGDLGSPLDKDCPCGRSLPLMDIRAGKIGHMVRTKNGQVFNSELFDYVNKSLMNQGVRGVGQFLVIQEALDSFIIEFVADAGDTSQAQIIFESSLRQWLGSEIQLKFQLVDRIRRHDGGKLGYFECRIPEKSTSDTFN